MERLEPVESSQSADSRQHPEVSVPAIHKTKYIVNIQGRYLTWLKFPLVYPRLSHNLGESGRGTYQSYRTIE